MKGKSLLILVIALAVLLGLFFAPVIYWYDADGGPVFPGHPPYRPVYRSLGCLFFGIGATYSQNLAGFEFGCMGPPVPL